MADDFYGYDDGEDEPKERDNLFLWTVFILLLIGVAFACWLGSFYIFGHPEQPGPYRFLVKMKKLDPLRRFDVTAAPLGDFVPAKKLFDRYATMAPRELAEENALLLRNYIKNYRETKTKLVYVTGKFLILDAFDLRKTDMFPSGVVALAQSVEFPQVVIEHVYPAPPRHVAALRTLLRTGLETKIEKTNDLSVLLHVERLPDGHMLFTVMPLLYGNYALKAGEGTFSLEPPTELVIETGLPVVKQTTFDAGLKKFADYRRTHSIAVRDAGTDGVKPPPNPELVRVDPLDPHDAVPPTGALPPVPVATPIPLVGGVTPRPSQVTPSPTPALAITKLVTPAPRSTATPVPGVSPGGVPLKPFIEPQRDPTLVGNGGSWKTFQSGKVPPGRSVSATEAGEMADRGEPAERIYLRGEFLVTASDKSRAIMREQVGGKERADGPRIIVDYPAGAVPPAENATTVRDATRPLQIRSVQRAANGKVNIYAVEIIQP
ncbi:MAG: hypothetical protein K8R23_02750 [Chthoniobacter sp.]|nr:hypothetical protein [Chthoniobacter sp.]